MKNNLRTVPSRERSGGASERPKVSLGKRPWQLARPGGSVSGLVSGANCRGRRNPECKRVWHEGTYSCRPGMLTGVSRHMYHVTECQRSRHRSRRAVRIMYIIEDRVLQAAHIAMSPQRHHQFSALTTPVHHICYHPIIATGSKV
jgi:hypothetical protein